MVLRGWQNDSDCVSGLGNEAVCGEIAAELNV